jgi:hypothetical protein
MLSAYSAACCAALVFAATPLCLAAQAPAAAVHVIVTSAETGEPLAGTQVFLPTAGVGGITSANGELRLAGVTPGIHRVEARRPGYAPRQETLTLIEGASAVVRFALPLQAVVLAALDVKAPEKESHGTAMLRDAGFFRRQAGGFGAFITRADIEQQNAGRLSDALRRIPGVQLSRTAFSDQKASMARTTGTRCPIQYFVNGVPVHGYNIDDMGAQEVEALEIYRGAAEIPPEFNRDSAMCGVIVIWTRVD